MLVSVLWLSLMESIDLEDMQELVAGGQFGGLDRRVHMDFISPHPPWLGGKEIQGEPRGTF